MICLLKNETGLGSGRKKKIILYIIITRSRERMLVMIYIISTRVYTYMYTGIRVVRNVNDFTIVRMTCLRERGNDLWVRRCWRRKSVTDRLRRRRVV